MSETGAGNGATGAVVPRDSLLDQLTLRFDRADGSLAIGGQVVNNEVALMILKRAVDHYEVIVRFEKAQQAKQAMEETARVNDILGRARGGRQ